MSTLYSPALTDDKILADDRQRWRTFCIDYRHWEAETEVLDTFTPNWQQVKFERPNASQVPEKMGIYMFVAQPSGFLSVNGQHRYIMYVGQASNLRERFSQYFGYVRKAKRKDQLKRIMVLIWQERLQFHYFETPGFTDQQLTKIEFDLINMTIPPINKLFRGELINQNVDFYAPR